MKKSLKITLWLTPILLFCLYWLGIYLSLKNPMEEIVYSENGGLMRYVMFKPYTQTIGSNDTFQEGEGHKTFSFSKNIIDDKQHLTVTVFKGTSDWLYMYHYKLDSKTMIGCYFVYDSSKKALVQDDVYLYENDKIYKGHLLLDKLSTYGKDRTWLKKQSKKVVEQYILGTWFKNGSSRYSLKNLGDMKIEYNKLLEK
ncbi:TipC family immunity protein [uncultured Streptococcus sp.]|uniref:TipC family immunity protein n=1 Tax=uncultured Streptococcus sp. TaxID=83427 RepID=UPI00259B61F2|nr:TipC family immunity protein [uncultured Streptococcus sp.]